MKQTNKPSEEEEEVENKNSNKFDNEIYFYTKYYF